MTYNRHPLQSQGAGLASRQLPDDAVVPYCNALAERLHWFSSVIAQEQQRKRLSAAAAKATAEFVQRLRATMMVMALKHGRQVLEVEPVPLTIDPTESGMPTFKDFWTLREDCEHAQTQLATIPDQDALLDQATEAIFRGERPVKQQILWLQRAYLDRLAATAVVKDFEMLAPVPLDATHGDRAYTVSWTGIVRSLNLFECSTLQFIERGGWHVSGGLDMLRNLISAMEGGRHSLQEMLGLCNDAAWIVPQTLERVTIGPYYHRWTENDAFTVQAFEAAHDEPWLLRATVEQAAATRPAARSTMDRLLGHEPMEIGPTIRSQVLLVPLAIKQQLGDADEDGTPAIVYGLSQDGDLVC